MIIFMKNLYKAIFRDLSKKFSFLTNKEAFNPGLLGLVLNPWYMARKGLWREISFLSNTFNGRLIDIGCGQKPYESLFENITEYIGIEIETVSEIKSSTKADTYYDGKKIPFPDQHFDCFLCNEVLEHVFNPDEFLDEIKRVLKKGGHGIITLPFVWDEHEQPYDYARYSSFGIKHLLTKNGFEIEYFKKTCNDIRVIGQLLIAYIYKIILGKKYTFARHLFLLAFSSVINIFFTLLSKILPKNNDLYLDNIILVRKI